MSKQYVAGRVNDKNPLKEEVGQFFFCSHCLGYNVYCVALAGTDKGMEIVGLCKDCGKKTVFLVQSKKYIQRAKKKKLMNCS